MRRHAWCLGDGYAECTRTARLAWIAHHRGDDHKYDAAHDRFGDSGSKTRRPRRTRESSKGRERHFSARSWVHHWLRERCTVIYKAWIFGACAASDPRDLGHPFRRVLE